MKQLRRIMLLLCTVICSMALVSCEEDTTEDVYAIEMGEMSEAYTQNMILRTCANMVLGDCLAQDPVGMMRTEKQAKEWFDAVCVEVQNSWILVNTFVTIEPDTWVEMKLVNSKKAVVKTKKVKFEEQSF